MNRKSVASKFNLLIILFIIISISLSSLVITLFLLQRYNRDVIEKDMLHMKGLAGSVRGFIEHAFTLNYLLSINPKIVKHVTAAPKDWTQRVSEYDRNYDTSSKLKDKSGLPLLVDMQKSYDFVELFFVQDKLGDQTSRSFGPLGHRGQRWWFQKITDNQNYNAFMSKSYYSMTGDKPVASAFHPIFKDNRFIGIMGTDINFDKLQSMVQNYLDSNDLSAMVIDPEGVVIAHPDKKKLSEIYNLKKLIKKVLVKDAAGESIQNEDGYHQTEEVKLNWDGHVSRIITDALNGNSGMAEDIRIDNRNSTLYYEPIQLPGEDSSDHYSLILIRDNSSIARAQIAICAFIFFFTALTIVAFIFFFRVQFRKFILEPVRTLADSMKDTANGNHQDIMLGTNDEFQVLGDTYNMMRTNLAKANGKLSDMNERLEQIVDERMDELTRLNIRLVEDITKREEVENSLRKSEERYELAVKSGKVGIWDWDLNSNKIYIAPNLKAMFGYKDAEIPNQIEEWADHFHPEDKASFREITESLKNGTVSEYQTEHRIRHRDGSVLWFLGSGQIQNDIDGISKRFIGTETDITELKQTEIALQQSESRYRSLVENTLDGYFICRIPSGKFLFLNRRILRLFGYTMKEVLNLTLRDMVIPEAYDNISELIQARLKGKFMKFDRQIYRAIRKDGSTFRAEVSTSMVTFQDQTAIQGVLRDITDQEHLQEQIQKAERMQAIGTLAGGIAHDFNNLLMGIQGRTSLMLIDTEESHPDYDQLKGIEDHVRRAANLTNQLLGFARGGKYQIVAVNLNELIKKNAAMFGRTKKEISIHTKLQQNIWTVEVDKSQLDQVLLNLYVNAWQAMPGGGQIYIKTKNRMLAESFVRPFFLKPGKYIEVSVEDTGVGMDHETRKRIFEPFFTTKEKERGTGLGLASAYGIIKNHDGIITVQSDKGKGSNFSIYLPASEKIVSDVKIIPEEQRPGEGTVLLVDDEDMILEVGKAILDKLGYCTLTADSGERALEIYRGNQNEIELVILDMVMPEISGAETYDRLKEIDPQIKILLSSGYSLDGDARGILKGSSDGFIQKPFDIKILSGKLRQLLK
jgi:two-component system, cell cycle sensor histidine kinase and response regulator CckA